MQIVQWIKVSIIDFTWGGTLTIIVFPELSESAKGLILYSLNQKNGTDVSGKHFLISLILESRRS
jgi:hypothetical protein